MLINTNESISAACKKYGARSVYDAAISRLAGDNLAMPKIGLLNSKTLEDAVHVSTRSYLYLADREQAQDLARAEWDLAKLPTNN